MRRLRVVTLERRAALLADATTTGSTTPTCRAVAHVLDELDPDVVLLQELVDARQLDGIVTRLSRARAPFAGAMAEQLRLRSSRRRGGAQRARAQLRGAWARQLQARTSCSRASTSAAACARRRSRRTSTSSRPTGAPSRPTPWRALAEDRGEQVVVAGGDFNLDPAWAAGTANARDLATFTRLTRTLADAGRDAGATLVGLLRVDHLLVRGSRRWLARVSPRRLPLGDHHPLVLDVDLDSDVASTV